MTTKTMFEFFDASTAAKRSSTPQVNISRIGKINFNKKLVEEYVKDNKFALIGINPKNKKEVGIQFLKENPNNKAYKIIKYNNNNSHYISATAFFKTYQVELDKVFGTHDTKFENDILVFQLDERKEKADNK